MSHPTEDDVKADKLVTGLGPALESASARLRAASESARSLDFGKRIQVWQAAQHRLLPILAERGWVPSIRMVPRDIVELLKVFDEQGGDALDQRMIDLCRRDRVTGIASSTGVFAAWGPVFSKAARAHQSGDYELAVPIWLLAIEGVVVVTLNEPGFFKKVRRTKVQARVADRLRIDGSVFSEFADAWVDAISTVALPTEKAAPAILNRNAVLHGQVPGIGTEKDSLQGMLFLNLFEFLLGAAGRRRAHAQSSRRAVP